MKILGRISTIAAAVLCCAVLTLAVTKQSQGPSPTKGETSQTPQSKPENNHQGTDPSQASPKPVVHAAPENDCAKCCECKSAEIPGRKDQKAETDLWLVAFTGVLALVAGLQFFALLWQVLTTRNIAERQLRAYVLPTLAEITRIKSENSSYQIKVEVTNCGQTPAYDYRGYLAMTIRPKGDKLEGIEATPKEEMSTGDLGPGIKFELGGKAIIDGANFSFISAGTHALYVYGKVTYRDIFYKERQSVFRMVSTKDIFTKGRFANCPEGNHSD